MLNIYGSTVNVDVIVPIYKGKKYIKGIINQLEACFKKTDDPISIQVILVNDDPNECFDEKYFSKSISVVLVETDRNRGIHGARVRGLSYCTGDYVVFLDQDDRLSENYFKSQLKTLGSADAVICKAINGRREFYDCDKQFEKLVSPDYMFSIGNGILSSGQVLMRREAISLFWMENILQCNGADDWMLWLCMLYEGCCFATNQDVLYEHILGIGNCSESIFGMFQSEKEMYEVLKRYEYFDAQHLIQLKKALQGGTEVRLKEMDRLMTMVGIYDMWLEITAGISPVVKYLKRNGWNKIAIYGMGKMGLRLCQNIGMEVEVKCFIDRNASYIKYDIPIYTLEDNIPQLDLVIIALTDRENKILDTVSSKLQFPVKNIEDIIQEILKDKEKYD